MRQNKTRKALIIITPLLVLSILVAVSALKRHSDIISSSQHEANWYILQLTKEYAEFNYQLRSYQGNLSDYNDMMLQYEILWSRFKTILSNSAIIHLHLYEGALEQIQQHFDLIKAFEPRLVSLAHDPDPQIIHELVDTSRNQYENLVLFVNNKFRLTSGDLKRRVEATEKIEIIIHFMLVVTLILGGALFYTLVSESRLMRRLAMYDSLTGVHNRLWLNQKLDQLTENNEPFRFYLIDLDGFKQINDTLGHQAGDELLVEVAKRLSCLNAAHYRVARMGGDEFAIIEKLQADPMSSLDAVLMDAFKAPAYYAKEFHAISASIGASEFPKHAKTVSHLLQQADFAMYEVKQQGKNGMIHYSTRQAEAAENSPMKTQTLAQELIPPANLPAK